MMKKKMISLVACAGILVAGLSVKPAMAYFTDYASASGSIEIAVDDTHSTVEESGEGQQKIIVIDNDMATKAFVRVQVVLPEGITAAVDGEKTSEEDWTLKDGYYYYNKVLEGKSEATTEDSTSQLILNIDASGAVKTGENEYADFNVIVIPESAKVLYDTEGNPYADWSQAAQYSNVDSYGSQDEEEQTTSGDETDNVEVEGGNE
ncbi:MAG: hypothetical protein PUB52_11390 [Lachnospiraceae bacterium]|nr:hypothetical protein [Lachnospiraceae bacterium]MDD6505755.1 hypothetical protein [Lachnospiraceae bacterium]